MNGRDDMIQDYYPRPGCRVRTEEQRGIRLCLGGRGAWKPFDTADLASLPAARACKFCLMCQTWLPIDTTPGFWYPDKAKADGLGAYCKACMLARVAARKVAEVVR